MPDGPDAEFDSRAEFSTTAGATPGADVAPEQQLGPASRRPGSRDAAARRLRAQRAISAALSRPLNLQELTHAVLGAALDQPGAQAASLGLIAASGDGLQVTEVSGPERRVAQRLLALSAPDALAAAAREGRTFFLERPSEPAAVRADEAPPTAPPRAAAAAPLVAAGRVLGAVSVTFTAPHLFGDGERAFVLALAQQLAEAVERQRLAEHERAARASAEAARRAKNEFLAMVSHEIRTPLNAIVGYTELLELQLAGPITEAQQAYLDRLRASARHLLAIINDMLDLAKVEAGRLLVTHGDVSARETIEATLAIVHPQAAARSIVLLSACDAGSDARYRGDPRRVEQIVLNLLSNAVRFTEPAGRVTAGCSLVDAPAFHVPADHGAWRWCAIEVADTGIGIAPEHLARIFDPFVQVDSVHTRTRGGSGLGLAISRRLARLMDGEVTVESQPGVGSRFTLWLPAAEAESRVARHPAAMPSPRTQRAPGLMELGDAVLSDVAGIVERYMERLRSDPETQSAHRMSESDLENHTATFVTNIAQALSIIEEQGGTGSALMTHDHEIQQLIADRHGELRRQLGWGASELERDFQILWEEVQTTAQRVLPADEPAVTAGLDQLKRFFDRAFESSRLAYRREAQTPRGTRERSAR